MVLCSGALFSANMAGEDWNFWNLFKFMHVFFWSCDNGVTYIFIIWHLFHCSIWQILLETKKFCRTLSSFEINCKLNVKYCAQHRAVSNSKARLDNGLKLQQSCFQNLRQGVSKSDHSKWLETLTSFSFSSDSASVAGSGVFLGLRQPWQEHNTLHFVPLTKHLHGALKHPIALQEQWVVAWNKLLEL